MKTRRNRNTYHASLINQMLSAKSGEQPVPELTTTLSQWLAQLTLLYGMPMEYMIPDARLLPNESIRFFYLDRNWLDRLVDGAMSAGVLSTQESVFNSTFFEEIYAQIDAVQMQLRSTLKGKEAPEVTEVAGPISGLLFRSQVVSGWPGLEIQAYSEVGTPPPESSLLNILRMDRLAPSIMLCLFDGVPKQVDIIEPSEGLHFGINLENDGTSFEVSLRGLGYPESDPLPAGEQIPKSGGGYYTATGGFVQGTEAGVVDVKSLVGNIESNMPTGAIPNGTLTPSEFGIQMVKAAALQAYMTELPNGGGKPDDCP